MRHEPLGDLFIWCVNKFASVRVPAGSFPVSPTEKKKKMSNVLIIKVLGTADSCFLIEGHTAKWPSEVFRSGGMHASFI